GDRNVYVARIAHFAVRTEIAELKFGIFRIPVVRFRFPITFIDAFGTSVQVVGSVIGGQLNFFAVEGEFGSVDASGDPSGQRAEMGVALEIILQSGQTERNIIGVSVPVWYPKFGEYATEGHDFTDKALAVV